MKKRRNQFIHSIVQFNCSIKNQVGFELPSVHNDSSSIISPEEVGTSVLKHLLKLTADFLGHNQVNKAVIAVPAKFNSNQRAATAMAYKNAGLKVVRVIEEPTAAAVAYDLHKKPHINHILVYDFGGGTLDVSLLFVSKSSVQVYATDGDESLGGSDFDMAIYEHLKWKVKSRTYNFYVIFIFIFIKFNGNVCVDRRNSESAFIISSGRGRNRNRE